LYSTTFTLGGAEDKLKLSVGREIEKLKASAQGENILGLSNALANWHLLNRHVEEAELLIVSLLNEARCYLDCVLTKSKQ